MTVICESYMYENLLTDNRLSCLQHSRRLFQTDPHALQIIIHYDDLEVCNPLGTKSSLHKVGT